MPRPPDAPPPSRPAFFWWVLANALALCFAVITWALSLHIFGYPEIPRNYQFLKAIGRLDKIKHFTQEDVPKGNAVRPDEQYAKFFAIGPDSLRKLNTLLIRNYLNNFERPLLLTYLEGDYRIEEKRLLTDEDFVAKGIVVKGHAMVKPDEFTAAAPYPVVLELILPNAPRESLLQLIRDQQLEITKGGHRVAVIHVERQVDDEGDAYLCLTAIPILYGNLPFAEDTLIEIEPPEFVNPGASFPVIKK